MTKLKKNWVRAEYTVPFYDLDPMQVVWHGNYLNYFEQARDLIFSTVGIDLYRVSETDAIVFPVIRSETKHILPLRHRDRIEVSACVVEAHRKIVVDFIIRRLSDGAICAKGRTEQVAVSMKDEKMLWSIPELIGKALLP